MSSDEQQDNPFAVSPNAAYSAVVEAADDWFEVRGESLICHGSLRLPQYCLVTGEDCPEAAPFSLRLVHNPGFSLQRMLKLLGVVLLSVIWVLSFIALITSSTASLATSPWLTAVTVLLCVVAFAGPGLVAIYFLRRVQVNRQQVLVTAFLSRGRNRIRFWVGVLPLVFFVPMMVMDSFGGILPARIGGFWFVPFLIMNTLSHRLWLRGLALKVKPEQDGRFEMTGFSPAFLARLKS